MRNLMLIRGGASLSPREKTGISTLRCLLVLVCLGS